MQKMKFFKSRALAITVIVLTVVMLIGMTVLSMRLYLNLDPIKTPYMLLEGEYSVDGGDFKLFDSKSPINDHFHTITFKGRIPENIFKYYEEISFSTKNVWYKWSTAGGEVIMEHKYQTLDEMCEDYFSDDGEYSYTDEEKQRFIENIKKTHPLEYDMPGTPGYTSYVFTVSDLKELGIDKNTEMVFEFKNPYEYLMSDFSDLTMFTVSHVSGSNVGMGNYLRLFRDVLPVVGLYIIVSLFGLFFFPLASFILGKIDYKYLTFGVLCFFWGLYMVIQNISGYLPMWITDHAMCPLIDKPTGLTGCCGRHGVRLRRRHRRRRHTAPYGCGGYGDCRYIRQCFDSGEYGCVVSPAQHRIRQSKERKHEGKTVLYALVDTPCCFACD